MTRAEAVPIDGSYGEGGGQVLRTSLALSLLTRRPVVLRNIRARRPKPGLAPQHLTAVWAAAEVGRARVEGDVRGSKELRFEPCGLFPESYRWDIGTAGATSLVLHTVALPLALTHVASDVRLTGGTHVPWSPPFEHLERVWVPALASVGFPVQVELRRAGFYPRGGGEIFARLGPAAERRALVLGERGELRGIHAVVGTARLPEHVSRRAADRVRERLRAEGLEPRVEARRVDAPSPGAYVFLRAETESGPLGASALGERGKPAEAVADEAVDEILAILDSRASVDPHLADQLLLPLALVPEESVFLTARVTRHLLTNAWVIRRFLPEVEIEIDAPEGVPGRVRVRGVEPG